MMLKAGVLITGVFVVLATANARVQSERIDQEANAKIQSEALDHSQLSRVVHLLSDRYGPRLTGSPNYAAAATWAAAQLGQWGLKDAHLESFDMGHAGWSNQFAYGYLTLPISQNLVFQPVAWTPSTNGAVSGSIVQLVVPQAQGATVGRARSGPTKDEMDKWLSENAARVRGKIVMLGRAAAISADVRPAAAKRLDSEQLRTQYVPKPPAASEPSAASLPSAPIAPVPDRLTLGQANGLLDTWLSSSGALLVVRDAARPFGEIESSGRFLGSSTIIPTVALRNEDFGRIERLLGDGEDVRAEFNIANRSYSDGHLVNNVLAEIPGSDKAAEVVMIGAHLDSWHAATGATDNAIGVATAMEVVRIINALGLKPRRTIRIALWAGEELGLLGSSAYVKEHFGSFEAPVRDFDRLDSYINLDTGTGRLRGARVFGPQSAADVISAALAPFQDRGTGVIGAIAGRDRGGSGADTASFRLAGLPGIGWDVDPIDYERTQHTNLDTYERILADDAMKNVTVVAALAWHLANRNEMLPRFTKDDMPRLPGR